ncbi:MAG TPA: universal stress protein, partial [Gemmataceae bacterium]
MIELKKVLYATDFSSFSTPAYFHALAVAENRGASLTIVYVYTPEGTPD